ncbi:PAS domain-containing hybrid sensor histidine kinase/response regulator [Chondrinema litorale]|uniref:PAS domain-containing hybrid sensor histidine kinase/response regulator n=1 Tax=Chondrinema litorale TaxID=2994555 RepID=UPI002543608B|nr:ATP-binding protein [Chondrinema litorale]UZR98691.1 ATP-binding protein [Chondrinema litorale]
MGKVKSKNISESNSDQEVKNQKFLEKLADKEQVIEAFQECTLTGFWEWLIREEKLFLNKNLLNTLGYNDSEITNNPADFAKFIYEQDYHSLTTTIQKHILSNTQKLFEAEIRFYHKQGYIIYVNCKGKIVSWDNENNPIKIIGCCTDISNLKKQEANYLKQKLALGKTIKKYADIVQKNKERDQVFKEAREIAQFGTWNYDIILNKVEWSDESYKIFGLDYNEGITLKKFLDCLAPESKELIKRKTAEALNNKKKIELELKAITPQGEERYVLATSKVIEDEKTGDPIFLRGALQNITARKKAETDLTHYQKGLEFLNEVASNVNLSYDEQIQIALEKVCNYLQLPLAIMSKITDEDYQVKYIYSNKESLNIEAGTVFPLKDVYCNRVIEKHETIALPYVTHSSFASHPCYEHFSFKSYIGAPVYVNGKVYGTINCSSPEPKQGGFSKYDIQFIKMLANWAGSTFGRKQYEEKLIEAKKKAEEASIAKEQFLSTMSHEIRTPMNAVIGMSHLLMQDNPQPHQVEKIKTLKFSAENLLSLINDILDINKIESGMITFEEIDFDLFELLNGIKHSLKVKAEEKNIKLKIKYDNDIPSLVLGDPTRLSQILINLVGNALKFTEEGFVSVEVEVLQETDFNIDINFVIEDSGIGIPKHKMDVIFERFSQANGEITRKFGGSGLGLSIVKYLVELQGSEVIVESEVGKGSKFSFTLRFKKAQTSQLNNKASLVFSHEEKNLEGINILVVEDNAVNQLVAGEFLGKWNTNITFADNGLIALEKIEQEEFDIILMDLQMPVMDGYEATKKIRLHPNEDINTMPIIALTASVMIKVKEKVVQTGFNEYVTKPFNPNELYSKIKKLSRKASYSSTNSNETIITENEVTTNQTKSNQPVFKNENIISFEKLEEMADGNESFKTAIINQLKSDTEEFRKLITEAVENQSEEKVSFAVHWFQTSLELFSLEELKTTIRNFREKLKDHQGDTPYFLAGLEDINLKIDEVLSKL